MNTLGNQAPRGEIALLVADEALHWLRQAYHEQEAFQLSVAHRKLKGRLHAALTLDGEAGNMRTFGKRASG